MIDIKQKRILVIDDNMDYCSAIKGLLERRYKVETAYSGQEGLDRMPDYRPDVVLLDLMMPVMNGQEVLVKIRQADDKGIRETPVIIVSATKRKADVAKAIENGSNGYVTKPFDFQKLVEKIEKVCRH